MNTDLIGCGRAGRCAVSSPGFRAGTPTTAAGDDEAAEARRLGGLGGSGGNSTIIIGKTGVIVVDAKQTEAGAKDLLAEIAKITPKPVTTVFLTHSDGDHVNGLVAYPTGIKIIAHQNNKKELETALAAGGRGAPPPDRLPTQVVQGTRRR